MGPLLLSAILAVSAPERIHDKSPYEMVAANLASGGALASAELIVRTDHVDRFATIIREGEKRGCKPLRAIGRRPLYILDCVSTANVLPAIAAFEKIDGVRWIEASYAEEMEAEPNDLRSEQWYHRNDGSAVDGTLGTAGADMGSVDAWDISAGERERTILIIDSGVYPHHEDLRDQIWQNADEDCTNGQDDDQNGYIDDCRGWDFGNDDNDPDPSTLPELVGVEDCLRWHATMIAGLAAAHGNNGVGIAGVNWNVSLMNVKKHRDASCESTTTRSIESIAYGIDNGADVISMSFSSSTYNATFEQMLQEAERRGLISVSSGGNGDRDNDTLTRYPNEYDVTNKLVVVNSNNRDEVYEGSNYGARSVDLAAPGTFVLSTSVEQPDAYGFGSGSSYPAGIVAGAVTLVWSAFPALTSSEVMAAIKDGAERVPGLDCANTPRCVSLGARLDLWGAMVRAAELAPAELSAIDPQLADLGDGDGVIEKGERFELRLAIANSGRGGAFFPKARLTTGEARVTMLQDLVSLANLAASATSDPGAMEPFLFEVPGDCSEPFALPVTIGLEDRFQRSWQSTHEFQVYCEKPPEQMMMMPMNPDPNVQEEPAPTDLPDSESCAAIDPGRSSLLSLLLLVALFVRRSR